MDKNQKQIIANNKKAYHDYFVLETYEAGIELFGTEIKSIRNGKVNLKDSFCSIDDGEMFVIGMHISPYEQGNRFNRDPMRKKRLLLHKKEIMKLFGESQQQGLSIIPLKLASPRFFAKELPSSPSILTMPLPIVLTAFHTAERS